MGTDPRRWIWMAVFFLLGGIAPLFAATAVQEEAGIRLEVDKRQVEVGDSLTVKIEYRRLGGGGGGYVSGEPSIPTLENFDVRGTSTSTSVRVVNNQMAQVSTRNIRLVATKPGEVTLGPAIVLFEDGNQGRRELKSNTVVVTVKEKSNFSIFGHKKKEEAASAQPPVQAAPRSADDLRDIRGLAPPTAFPWGFVFWPLVVAVAAYAAYRYWKKKRSKNESVTPKTQAEVLKERYRNLGRKELSGEEFCRTAASLARACLSYRYEFPAEDRTTLEVLSELKKRKASEAVRENVEKCLKTCDRVLYAEGVLSAPARESTLQALSNLLPKA